ncbi:SDR family NAD(P)-dependent oxidoreductase [Pararhodobacter marinus]|uniref:SDR family NAD(P)-dependent oxidoreductase n=1 Tax=Pararhodobacter marinus TaxID=2184063 RepID=UPI003518E42C
MQNLGTLGGKVIVVTGAGQGIGRALAGLIADLGGTPVAVDLNGEALEALKADIPQAHTLTGDVSDVDFAAETMAGVAAKDLHVTGLVNNAGITRPAMIKKMTESQWDDVIRVHLKGAYVWTQAVGRAMLEQAGGGKNRNIGSMVHISSIAGRGGSIGQINYAAAKAGIFGISMTAAKEWARYGIRSNTVSFGVVETPMTEVIRGEKFRDDILSRIPMGYWAEPLEVIRPVAFLLSDSASYITGQNLGIDGGMNINV